MIGVDGDWHRDCWRVRSDARQDALRATRYETTGVHDLAGYLMALKTRPDLPRLALPEEVGGIVTATPRSDRPLKMLSIMMARI